MAPTSELDLDISVVLRTVGGIPFLLRTLRALRPQVTARTEVVIAYDDTLEPGIDQVKAEFPEFRYIAMGPIDTAGPPGSGAAMHELYDRRTSAGFCAARGPVVVSLEDYGTPADNWLAETLRAHRELPHGVIGGCVEQVAAHPLNWAIFYLDFGRFEPPLPEGSVEYLSDVNVSYKREALELVRPLWEVRYNEAVVHWELARLGVTLWRRPQILVRHDRGPLAWSRMIHERVSWGRLFGAVRAQQNGWGFRVIYASLAGLIPLVLVARIVQRGVRHGQSLVHVTRSLPALLLMAYFWSWGEFLGYVTGQAVTGRPLDACRR